MNKRVIIDSVIISLLAAAAIKFAYGVENIYVVLGINIMFIVGLYFILSSCDKNSRSKEEENTKNILKQSQSQMEQLATLIDLQGNKNIDNIQKLVGELKSEISTVSKEINSSINESTKINTEAMSVLKEICKENIELNKNLSSNHASLVEKLISLEDKLSEGNNKIDVVISSIVDNSKSIKIVNESMVESNNKLADMITKCEEEVDKLIDIKGSLESLNDKVEDLTSIDRDNQDILSDIKSDNSRLNMELRTKIDEAMDSNNNIVTKYDFIQKSFTAELLKVAAKNENVTNMLMDNYKILKEVVDSI